jgi:hypothetical protein
MVNKELPAAVGEAEPGQTDETKRGFLQELPSALTRNRHQLERRRARRDAWSGLTAPVGARPCTISATCRVVSSA